MLDIMDKHGKVVAVLMDDGTVIKKDKSEDDIDALIRERLSKLAKKGKHK
jgi:hypothetical protein